MPHIKGRQQREGPPGTQSANPQPPCLTYGPLCIEVGTLLSASSLDLCLQAGAGWAARGLLSLCPLYNNVGHHSLCFPAGRRWLCLRSLCIHFRGKEHSFNPEDYSGLFESVCFHFGVILVGSLALSTEGTICKSFKLKLGSLKTI